MYRKKSYGYFPDFLESMKILIPAIEAEDITREVTNDVNKNVGRMTNDDTTNQDVENNQVDNTSTNDQNNQDNNQAQNENNEDTQQQTNDNNTENAEEDPNVSDDENNQDINGDENPETIQSEDKPGHLKKNKIRDHIVNLYSIVSGDIELITNSLSLIENSTTIQVLNTVLNHLNNCKTYCYKLLVDEAPKLEYEELLQKYITLKKVYDICGEMLKKHFKSNGKNKLDLSKVKDHKNDKDINEDQ